MRKADAISKIRAGHPLICEFDADEGKLKYVVAGGGHTAQDCARDYIPAQADLPERLPVRDAGASIVEAPMIDCRMCAFAERYRDHWICRRFFGASTPFVRSDESQCGEEGRYFMVRTVI